MSEIISFGEWLGRRRKALGLTQKVLANQLNCATITLRKIEADQRRPSMQIAERLAVLLTIPTNEHEVFIRFSRGDWQAELPAVSENLSWGVSRVALHTNIPVPLTKLIGREQEVTIIKGYLQDPNIRLITLIGPPGVGKTRLCTEVAHELIPSFPEGVFFLPLASYDEPNQLAQNIFQVLGLDELTREGTFDRLRAGDKHWLIVLDSIDHLIEDVSPLVIKLLEIYPNIKILVTSREALRLNGELVYRILPLNFPTEWQVRSNTAESAYQYASLRLFSDRAREVVPKFTLDAGNMGAVAAICNLLDGLPLAIEIMTAYINLMSPHVLLSHLNDELIFHTPGARSLPPHQKTLQQAINWSYSLLTFEEQILFARLSTFAGSFSLEAVGEFYPSGGGQSRMIELMASLVEKSLLQASVDRNGESRFYMLRLIRKFAAQKLREINQGRLLQPQLQGVLSS